MPNRAKCKKCNEIIESKSRYDFITCKCGEITVSGGSEYFHINLKEKESLMLVDDEGNEIIPKTSDDKNLSNDTVDKQKTFDKKNLLDELTAMMSSYENLPSEALYAPVTHADFYSLLLVLTRLLDS